MKKYKIGTPVDEIMRDQAVEIRELIPDRVNGISTESMACCPTEVFYFTKLYIEELQDENKKLKKVFKLKIEEEV